MTCRGLITRPPVRPKCCRCNKPDIDPWRPHKLLGAHYYCAKCWPEVSDSDGHQDENHTKRQA